MTKGDTASMLTVMFSGLGAWLHSMNATVAEFMPMITAFGILSGTALTAWFYKQQIKQRQRDRALIHRRIEHEIAQGRPMTNIDLRQGEA